MNQDDQEFEKRVAELAKDAPPEALRQRANTHFEALRARMDARDLLQTERRPLRPLRWAFAAGAAAVAALAVLTLWPAAPPTWADVVEEFATMPHVHATFYVEQDRGGKPERVDLWLAQGGRLRIEAGQRVWFGKAGRITQGFEKGVRKDDLAPEGAVETVFWVTQSVGDTEAFSFETILRALPPGGAFRPARPRPGQATPGDLVAFDFRHPDGSETRVWALREGRAPIRTLHVNKTSGERVDVVLDYAEPPEPGFFRPDALARAG